MKIRGKLIVLFLVFITAYVVFIASRKQYNSDLLTIKNVEALADGETGWEHCEGVKGFCLKADGTVWTEFLNLYNRGDQ